MSYTDQQWAMFGLLPDKARQLYPGGTQLSESEPTQPVMPLSLGWQLCRYKRLLLGNYGLLFMRSRSSATG